jgi:flagellar hook-length control protein FliK
MAADAVPLSVPGGGAVSQGPVALRGSPTPASSGGPNPASSPAPAASTCGSAGANSSTSPTAQPSADGSSASGSGAASSASAQSKPSGKGSSGESGNTSGVGSRDRSGASRAGPAQTTAQGVAQAAAGTNDFSAALAQSLATTSADSATTTDTSAAKSPAADTSKSSEPPAKQSGTDPVSTALTLLEQALAGAMVGIPSTLAVSGAPAASTNSASSPDSGAIHTVGNGSAAALNALLTQNLASDLKAGASNPAPAGGSSTSAAPAATANSAAAAFTAAAQLPSASHVGSQQGAIDSSTMALASQVGTGAWTDELGAKVTWMAHQGIESASLQLSPEHLGPLQVNISVRDGQASVWFGAAQPDTRTALQQSLPQLRQLFASQGLTLADAGVSREPPRGQSRQSSARSATPVSAVTAVHLESPGSRTSTAGGLGLLDTYV